MRSRTSYSIVFGLALVMGVASCAGPMQMRLASNPEQPAAQGNLKLGTTENGNTSIQLEVKHLAAPNVVNPGATVYLVWVRPLDPGSTAMSLGALQLNENLEGEMATATPLRAFDLFLTAEPVQAATYPTGKEFLTGRVQMRNK